MFPGLDRDIIDDVVRVKQGRLAEIDRICASCVVADDLAFCVESGWQLMLA